jgi:hypothetical protein
MSWNVHPEPADAEERAALIAAAEAAFASPEESAWWRSGIELDEGASPERAGREPD